MKDKKNLIVIIPFFTILFTFLILNFILEDNDISQEERRDLIQWSDVDTTNLSSLSSEIENYLIDQFPLRPKIIKAYTIKDKVLNRYYTRDTFISKDGWLFNRSYEYKMDKLVGAVTSKAMLYPNKKFYFAIAPTKNLVLQDKCDFLLYNKSPNNLKNLNFEFSKHQLNNLSFINTYSILLEKGLDNDQKKYYRTDFHWNALGATDSILIILDEIRKQGDLDFVPNPRHFKIEDLDKTFLGDLNTRFSNLYGNDDKPVRVVAKNFLDFKYYLSENDADSIKRDDIVSPGIDKDPVTYEDIYTHNLGYYRVTNINPLNDKSVLIIKDSMQNPTVDILSKTFREIKVVDPRLEKNIDFDQAVKTADIVLIFLNQDNESLEVISYLK